MSKISVIIPTFRRAHSLRRVLTACANQTMTRDSFEVIVAMDGEDAATESMLQELCLPIKLYWTRLEQKSGPAAARNAGAGLSEGEILLFLDDDILLVPQGLAEHVAAHRGSRNRVCLGQVRAADEDSLTPWERYLNARYEEHYDKLGRPGYRPNYRDCMSGNLSMPRALYEAAGGFDATFAATRHDDIEFAFRLQSAGAGFVHRPGALGLHLFVKDTDDGLRDAFANGASSNVLVRLHPDLWPHPAWERWQSYGASTQAFFRWSLASRRRMRKFGRLTRAVLFLVQRLPMPRQAHHAVFRLSYHTHFWWGVASDGVPPFVADPAPPVKTILK